jgi:hypothetical protein
LARLTGSTVWRLPSVSGQGEHEIGAPVFAATVAEHGNSFEFFESAEEVSVAVVSRCLSSRSRCGYDGG